MTPKSNGKKIGIIVAIEEYQENKLSKVDFALNDAKAMAKIFANTFKIHSNDLEVYQNDKAIYSKLSNEIPYFLKQLGENDQFYFFYAGHGFHNGEDNIITCWDTDMNFLENTTIPLNSILNPVKKAKCRSAVLFLDTCSSEIKNHSTTRNSLGNISKKPIEVFVNSTNNSAVFNSCSPGEKAYPSQKLKHGIWTHFVAKALTGEASECLNTDLEITDRSLQSYLHKSVTSYIVKETDLKKLQNPFHIVSTQNGFTIAKFEKENIQLPDALAKLNPDYDQLYWRSEESILFTKHPNFDKKKGHFEPTGDASIFVNTLTDDENREEIKNLYSRCKSTLGTKGSDMKKGDSTLDTPDFKYEIETYQNPNNVKSILTFRKLWLLKPLSEVSLKIDDLFKNTLDEIVVPYNASPRFENLLKVFENMQESLDADLDEDEDDGYLELTTKTNLSVRVNIKEKELVFKAYKISGVLSLAKHIEQNMLEFSISKRLFEPAKNKTSVLKQKDEKQ